MRWTYPTLPTPRPGRAAGSEDDERREAGDEHHRTEHHERDGAAHGRLHEFVRPAARVAGAGIGATPSEGEAVADEQRRAERGHEFPQHLVVEGHVRSVRASTDACYDGAVRMVVARCTVEYAGRLGARLGEATRLVILKADGSIAVHCDAKAYKPLNWMTPPCEIREADGVIVATNPKGETLTVSLLEVLHDHTVDLGDDPGLEKDGVEAELQVLIAARVEALTDGLTLIKREYPTDIGPVDLLCRDADGRAVVVEIKRVGEIAGVEQLIRYQERLDLDTRLAPTRGMFVATRIKPQARVFAESRGIECVEVDLEDLRGHELPQTRLF